ncbi:MAG: CD225/dispanin family protein [Pyrinomonadaceae bacterium]
MSQNWTPPPAGGGSATVPNYMVPAIISIFCCWPLAIPAIIFAAQVNNKAQAGDIAGAQDASKKAKMFSFIAIGIGVVLILIYVVMIVFFGGLSMMTNR